MKKTKILIMIGILFSFFCLQSMTLYPNSNPNSFPTQTLSLAEWHNSDIYNSLGVNEPYLRVKKVFHTYDYDESGTNNYGKLIMYADSSTCNTAPYNTIAKWNSDTTSNVESIRKYQGTCNTIARFNYTCPGDSVITSIGSIWDPYNCSRCEHFDRIYNFTCSFPKDSISKEYLRVHDCTEHPYSFATVNPEGEVSKSSSPSETIDNSLTTFSQTGKDSTLICPDQKTLNGIKSWYNKTSKTREFSISCCSLKNSENKIYKIDESSCTELAQSEGKKDYNQACSDSGTNQFIHKITTKNLASDSDRSMGITCCAVKG